MSKCNLGKVAKLALLKGYFHFKKLYLCHLEHMLSSFLFPRKVSFSIYSSFCSFSHPMI